MATWVRRTSGLAAHQVRAPSVGETGSAHTIVSRGGPAGVSASLSSVHTWQRRSVRRSVSRRSGSPHGVTRTSSISTATTTTTTTTGPEAHMDRAGQWAGRCAGRAPGGGPAASAAMAMAVWYGHHCPPRGRLPHAKEEAVAHRPAEETQRDLLVVGEWDSNGQSHEELLSCTCGVAGREGRLRHMYRPRLNYVCARLEARATKGAWDARKRRRVHATPRGVGAR